MRQEIKALRTLMKENKIDCYLVGTEDYHGSEYVGDYFKEREFLSGFTGSAGTLVVLEEGAWLWTDGRYFLQAEAQLLNTGIQLMKIREPGVPTIFEFLEDKLAQGMCLGYDGRTISLSVEKELKNKLERKQITFSTEKDLVDSIWTNRPPRSAKKVFALDLKYAGKSREEKLRELREKLQDRKVDFYVITSLDEICWLLNLRGEDVAYNPVVLSYLVVGTENCLLYVQEGVIEDSLCQELNNGGVKIGSYDDFYQELSRIPAGTRVFYDAEKVNSRVAASLGTHVIHVQEKSLLELPKAVKNQVEQENEREAHRKDGVALTKFMYWLKTNVGKLPMTECSVAEKLEELRREQEDYLYQSFEPIMAYAEHGAIVHYSATEATNASLEPRGLLLSDTGGHYLQGTTDVTRTYVLGAVTPEEKKAFTLVLAGHLNLAAAKFVEGVRGANLDILARGPLWEYGMDYNHGTGHGVGYLLNVHEGPNAFRWRIMGESGAVLEPGMITSNEPGYYEAEQFGIRHEDLILCVASSQKGFLEFETLTIVPFDLDGIDIKYLNSQQIQWLNQYHARVYEELSGFLTEDERQWLAHATRKI